MLSEYVSRLYEVYKNKGISPAMKVFGKSFGEYIGLEIFYNKMEAIKKSSSSGGASSRVCAEIVTGVPFTEILSNNNLETMILKSKQEFLNKIN